MSTRKMKTRFPLNVLAIGVLTTLAACGGGGGGDGTPAPQPQLPPVQQMSFTVSLDGMDVRRASNAEIIVVDTSGISQTQQFEQ